MSAHPFVPRRPSRLFGRPRLALPALVQPAPDPSAKKNRPLHHHPLPHHRLLPLSALVTAVALAFSVCALALARRFGAFVVDASAPAPYHHPLPDPYTPAARTPAPAQNDPSHSARLPRRNVPDDPDRLIHHDQPVQDAARDAAVGMGLPDVTAPPDLKFPAQPQSHPADEKPMQHSPKPAEDPPPTPAALSLSVPADARVSWVRSWPLSAAYDVGGLYRLSRHLNFSNRTMLNYFHMHKTGGVTTKVELMFLLRREENRVKMTKRGERMRCVETCYQLDDTPIDQSIKSIEHMWRCDFGRILNMTQKQRDSIDVMMGHQYWENGCDAIFGNKRQVKHFSIFRHPLPRKLSFFYHFFVRNLGRDEKAVDKDEIIAFLLGDHLPEEDPRTRDAGPNYYASRLLSNGTTGFTGNHRYEIPFEKQDTAIAQVLDRLDHRFAFVGLQLQPEASRCMLQKAMQVLAHEHGIDDLFGTPKLAENTQRLNTGVYPWTARKIWAAMDERQRGLFKQVEKVDLAIYDRVVMRFREDVKMFSCADRVRTEAFAEDVLE